MLARDVPSAVPATVPAGLAVDVTVPEVAAEGGPGAASAGTGGGGERIPVLDLFAGAGGLSIGLQAAGFDPVGAVEIMEDAAKTYEAHHDIEVDRRRLEEIPERELRAMRGKAKIVVGGPPCQPWSTGGLRRGDEDDRDGFTAMFRALDLIKPEAFIIENVAGLGRGKTRPYFLGLLHALGDGLGYEVEARILNAADYGVPQQRQRMFIVGLREGQIKFPNPTHGPGHSTAWRTAGEVLTDEPAGVPNPSIVTYAKNPDLRPSPFDGLLFNGGGRPINLDAPARTILASAGGNKTPFIDTLGVVPEYHATLWDAGQVKPREGYRKAIRVGLVPGARRITVAESAALQTFPQGMEFEGRRSSQYTQVGNAVPPKLATAVGKAVRAALLATASR
ncbi:MAG TPA: DNA (cytosine-5-)-methyltransferase [Solirubrobacterales bacterium]|nr:DNA (cytosine-5-)-methyltransferase [Solirubrobacterales bacterium]